MTQITDVSPLKTTNSPGTNRSVVGRMLALGCAPDGRDVYAGSYSNLWASGDGGQSFEQLTWPQPPAGEFDVPGVLGGWCVVDLAVAAGWRADRDLRFLTRFRPRGPVGIVGFGECGVWTALGNGDGTFQLPNVVLADFGYQAGGWRVDRHPRLVVDLNGDGCPDLVGFGDEGVWTALGNGDGTFQEPQFAIGNYGYDQGWRVDRHPRFLARLTRSGFADIVGFGTDGVWTATGNGDGTFSEPSANPVLHNFGYHQHWRVGRHPRFVLDVNADGLADIVGFGTDGVWTATGNGDGTFSEPNANPVLHNFGYHQGWRVDRHPRLLARLTGSGFPDIVGFGDKGVYVALGNGDGTFSEPFPNPVLENFGYEQGWRVDKHPRFAADLTGDGCADIVGFGDAGVWTAVADGDGKFADAAYVLANFGVEQGWRVDEHPRFVTDLTADGHADIAGFGDAGVWTAIGDGHGGFAAARFVLASFGAGLILLAISQHDLTAGSHGIWRSTDGGSNWEPVHQFPPVGEALGQLQWATGSDHLVYAAGGSALAISKNGGASFTNVFPWGRGRGTGRVNHVAVWQNSPADPGPAVIYALGDDTTGHGTMFLSFDGGTTWFRDLQQLPAGIGAAVSSEGNGNSPDVMVISPRWPLELIVAGNGSGAATPAVLHRGDYTQFFGSHTSSWDEIPLPDALASNQDSGNVFLVATRKGQGDLLFYGAQRTPVFVGPVDATAASDWHALDGNVHVDLHRILLSPDFKAEIRDGAYTPHAGSVWLTSDGGVYRSTDGGGSFHRSRNVATLSCVNVAGVSIPGHGPSLSLNTGDNDGFCSIDGGAGWSYQEYGGGDDDCSFADPLRPQSIIVFTPRWDTEKELPPAQPADDPDWDGQTVTIYTAAAGHLPSTAANGHVVPGPPPLLPKRDRWNAGSSYGSRGFRPIVRGLADEEPPDEGDYVFILDPISSPVLVRTQNILDIQSRDEWLTSATGPGQGANVYLQGPPLPNGNLGIVQTSGGHTNTVFYASGIASTLWTWQQGASDWTQLVPGGGGYSVTRFFVDPYRPNLVYLLDWDHLKRSEDGGRTWQVDHALEEQLTWNGQIPISTVDTSSGLQDYFDLVLTDMQFDPTTPAVRFAVGQGGAFGTDDSGATWIQLLHSGALPGRPANCYYDWITADDPALYVALAGRSILKLTDLFPPVIV